MKKKLTAWVLAACMLCPLAPAAQAADDGDTQGKTADAQTETAQSGGADMQGLLTEMQEQGFSFAQESDLPADAETTEAVVVATGTDSRKLSEAGVVQQEITTEPVSFLLAESGGTELDSAQAMKSGKTNGFSSYGEQLSDLIYTTRDGAYTIRIGTFAATLYQNLKNDVEKNTSSAVFQGSESGMKALSVTVTLNGLNTAYYYEVACAAGLVAYRSVDYDCPEMFYSNGITQFGYQQHTNGATVWCKPTYAPEMSTASERASIYTRLEAKAAEIIADAKQYTRAYDKLKYFHDWLCENNVYNSEAASNMSEYSDSYGSPWSAVSGLLSASDGYKGPVCEGYSRALQYLCDKAGISCAIMTSDTHMWNSVRYGSYWSGIDLTWDEDLNGSYGYAYFLTPVNDIDSTHSVTNAAYFDQLFGDFIDYPIETAITSSDLLPFYETFTWDEEYVQYVYDNEYMNGMTCVSFQPGGSLTRAQFATILYNIAGRPEVTYSASFSDVPEDQWYASACLWAAENGLVKGYPGGLFCPNEAITREQICTILYRRAGSPEGLDESALSGFADGEQISRWARDGVVWAVNSGIVTGRPGTSSSDPLIAPGSTSTRSEAAKIITVVQRQAA